YCLSDVSNVKAGKFFSLYNDSFVSNQANVFLTGFSGSSKPSWLSIFFDHAPAETIKESALNVWLSVSTLTISLWTDTFSTLLCVKIVAPCCTASFRYASIHASVFNTPELAATHTI